MKSALTPALLTALLALAPAAYADHHCTEKYCKTGECPHHGKMDTDKDGTISDVERAAYRTQKFDAADTNKDGQLSKEEFLSMPAHHHKKQP
jgi:hypothetical protein